MPDSLPSHVDDLIELARLQQRTEIQIREVLTSGKSGAFVAKVDCTGAFDGVFILKIGSIVEGWPDEEASHGQALKIGAFSGKVPKIFFSVRSKTHYALMLGLAGDSILQCKPLVTGLNFFDAAYSTLVDITWDANLVTLGDIKTGPSLLSQVLGYRLDETQGRIRKNVVATLGRELVDAPHFAFQGRIFSNPMYYAIQGLDLDVHNVRAALGPTHGDCHAHNIFVKSNILGEISDVFLIDLESFKENGLLFFDFSYFELATLLRHMDGLGDARWLSLVSQLITGVDEPLEPNERGWARGIQEARNQTRKLSTKTYPNRLDDLRQQRLLADIAAGLSLLNKQPRQGEGSVGLTPAQYRQAIIWSAVALDELIRIAGAPEYPSSSSPVPVLGTPSAATKLGQDLDWSKIGHFDGNGFNVLVVGPGKHLPSDVLAVDWALVLDFGREGAAEKLPAGSLRRYRQAWPHGEAPDPKFIGKGGIWYYADGRADISDAPPSTTPADWRVKYRRALEDLTNDIAKTISPSRVRILFCQQDMSPSVLRMAAEAISDSFGPETIAAILTDETTGPVSLGSDISAQEAPLTSVLEMIRDTRDPAPPAQNVGLVPSRADGGAIHLTPLPQDAFDRVSNDLTVVSRALAESFPDNRAFGLDFLRGLPIEWAELAQDLDVERAAYKALAADIGEALEANSNRTVNLTHEASAGGTTLSRRLAWDFMEKYPTVVLDRLTQDIAPHLREIFAFTSLPVLVVMEANTIKETEREALLRELREDNTRAVFLWVSRTYKGGADPKLVSTLDLDAGGETELFLKAYLRQTEAPARTEALRKLAKTKTSRERSPFFFGLTAFREEYVGVEKMVAEVMSAATAPAEQALLADLALVSLYSQRGFPTEDFNELCERLNGGNWPIDRESPYIVVSDHHVRIAHALLSELVLSSLARKSQEWKIDLSIYSETLIKHLRMTRAYNSDRIRDLVEEIFITRDRESAAQTDAEALSGYRRYSPLIYDIGNVETARNILKRVVAAWPDEPHFAAHLARHLFYEEPREMSRAVELSLEAEKTGNGDAILSHVVGMAYRIRMDARLIEAKNSGQPLESIETAVQADYRDAFDAFDRSMQGNSSHSLVSKVQMSLEMFRKAMDIAKAPSLSDFLKRSNRGWYLDALSEAETAVDILRRSPQYDRSTMTQRVLAEWNLVYGSHDAVIGSLRALAKVREDVGVRRALCAAIIAKSKHDWRHIPASDLRTIAQMTERNIVERGVLDTDVRRWLNAYRRLSNFDVTTAIARLVEWNEINPSAVEPPFYLYIFYFLRWLSAPAPRDAYASEAMKWLKQCQANRPFGQRTWSHEWLVKAKGGSSIANFRDLPLDPSVVLREGKSSDEQKLVELLSRVDGVVSGYRGPQQAQLDLGNHLKAKITPLDRLAKNDEGTKASAYMAFSYDGLIGWDARKTN